jgi:hypothetical protein
MTLTAHAANPQDAPGFDEDSPDVKDPMTDPSEPPQIPEDGPDVQPDSGVDDPNYPPFK